MQSDMYQSNTIVSCSQDLYFFKWVEFGLKKYKQMSGRKFKKKLQFFVYITKVRFSIVNSIDRLQLPIGRKQIITSSANFENVWKLRTFFKFKFKLLNTVAML